MKTNEKKTPDQERADRERKLAPYLIDPKRSSRLIRNYELFDAAAAAEAEVSNELILDYIDFETPEEARRVRGWLWNAFAAGKIVGAER